MKLDNLLTQDDHEAGAELNVISPVDGGPTDFYIKLMGVDSREFQRASKRNRSLAIATIADGKPITEDDELDSELNHMVAVTIGWRGLEDSDGKERPFTKEACKDLYDKAPFVRQQVDRFVSNRKNFTRG